MAPKKVVLKDAITKQAEEKTVVPISTVGMQAITIAMSMEERADEKKLPQVRATMAEPMLPVKLGSSKGVVMWKFDKVRLERFIQANSSAEEVEFLKKVYVKAAGAGMLTE